MKNKKRMYQGYNRKQLKEAATRLQKEVTSISKQLEEVKRVNRVIREELEEEKARHKEYKDLCVAYSSRNLDLKLAHDQAEQAYKLKLEKTENELAVTKNRNEKLVEQLEHFTNELQSVNVENAQLRSRSLMQRIFNK